MTQEELVAQRNRLLDIIYQAARDLQSLANHRDYCHNYDEDVGHEPRGFSDTDEWDAMEYEARCAFHRLRDGVSRELVMAGLAAELWATGR